MAATGSDADRFTLQTLGISSEDHTTFTVGESGSFAVTAEGAEPIALSASGTLPEGVSFHDDGAGAGRLTGTPAAGTAGVYNLTLTASNGTASDIKQSFMLTVRGVPGAPTGVKATAGVESAQVSWQPPSYEGLPAIDYYVVTASPGGASVTVDKSASSVVLRLRARATRIPRRLRSSLRM